MQFAKLFSYISTHPQYHLFNDPRFKMLYNLRIWEQIKLVTVFKIVKCMLTHMELYKYF